MADRKNSEREKRSELSVMYTDKVGMKLQVGQFFRWSWFYDPRYLVLQIGTNQLENELIFLDKKIFYNKSK